MAPNPLRKGPSSTGGGNSKFVTAKEEEPLVFAPLEELENIISADVHEFWDVKPFVSMPCIGKGCPACAVGNEAKYKSWLRVLPSGEAEGKILPMGIMIERAIADQKEEIGSIVGRVFKLKRTGKGFSTRYSLVPTDKKIDVSKVPAFTTEENIIVYDAEQMIAKLKGMGLMDDDGKSVEAPVEAKAKEASPTSAPKEDDAWAEA